MASTMTVNAHCARVRVDKKTLLSAKRGAFNGGAKAIMPARARAARGTATITAAGSAFIPEEFQSPEGAQGAHAWRPRVRARARACPASAPSRSI